jgi:hypothetical protein
MEAIRALAFAGKVYYCTECQTQSLCKRAFESAGALADALRRAGFGGKKRQILGRRC